MAITDPIGDLLTRIRNGQLRGLAKVKSPYSRQRVRDFRGLNAKSFDGNGNYALGLKEHIIFVEIDYDKTENVWGMDIIINTSARSDAEAKALLKGFQFPFIN